MVNPLIDVLIPVYNGETYIRSSVRSILDQSFSDFRVRIVDDGSTDGTADALKELAAADERVVIHAKANSGIVDALNHGLSFCTAELIARHDADDIAFPTRFARQVELFRARPELIATGCGARHIDPQGRFMGTVARFFSTDQADPKFMPAREPYLLHPFLMVRRQALADIGGYRHVVHAEDADLYWRLQEVGALFSDRTVHGEYRIHDESVSSRSVRNGRVMAVSSQLCALSASRRRSGQLDLRFSREDGGALRAASGSFEEVCRIGSAQLQPEEARRLRLAASAKLLEFAGYRPYAPEMEDCVFIRHCYEASADLLTPVNRASLRRTLSGIAAKLMQTGRPAEARVLLGSEARLPFMMRVLIRRLMPPPVYRRVRRAVGPVLFLFRGG